MASRREFVKTISGLTAAIGCGVAVSSMLQSCSSVRYVQLDPSNDQIRVAKNEFAEHKFVVVTSLDLPAPIYISHQEKEKSYIASLMKCTHLGCELKPTGSFLTCPCHGSEFSSQGTVLNGPADESLTSYVVTENDLEVIIELSKLKKS